jgi:serine/threonine-protein kinase
MEYLKGEDLAKVIARGLVPIATALRYGIETCEALDEAHELGVVHRDLKPANLFVVCDTKGDTRIKVLDFGISKWIDSEDNATELTASDAVVGSPLYMSPEQVRASRDVDLRTDIWAVGVVLYELVASRSPFTAASAPAVAVNVAASTPEPLSALRVGVTAELDAVVTRCLEKDREARFQSVGELAEALRAVLAAYQAQAAAPPTRRRSRWVLAASALAVVLCVGALWAFASKRSQGSEQKVQAITSTAAATQPPSAAADVQPIRAAAGSGSPKSTSAPEHHSPVPTRESERTRNRQSLDIGEVLPP